jgi:ubiquinone/menaquinone biosynthesis C-methylase UbiE
MTSVHTHHLYKQWCNDIVECLVANCGEECIECGGGSTAHTLKWIGE